jgi:hypothetical protein
MADKPLNFNPDDLGNFDNAPEPNDDLSAFDNASGVMVLPPGWYTCLLECGELWPTRTGKRAYRLRFRVTAPAEYAGFTLWRYYLPATDPNRTKAALAPLGLRTVEDLRRCPFPEVGRRIVCKVFVTVQKNDPTRNDVERFTVESDERDDGSAAARFALPPDKSEGGAP